MKEKTISVYSDDHAFLMHEKIKHQDQKVADTLRRIIKEWVNKR